MFYRQSGGITPHGIGCGFEAVQRPGGAQPFEIVADEERAAALTEVPDLSGGIFAAAQAALQMRH